MIYYSQPGRNLPPDFSPESGSGPGTFWQSEGHRVLRFRVHSVWGSCQRVIKVVVKWSYLQDTVKQ